MIAVVDALQALGGRARPAEVYEWLKRNGRIRSEDVPERGRDMAWLHREIRFARQELHLGGLIDGSHRGMWQLTVDGERARLTIESAQEIVSRRQHGIAGELSPSGPEPITPTEADNTPASAVLSANGKNEGPTRGPPPTNWAATVERIVGGPGWVYVMRFGERDIWKIGHSTDVNARVVEINKHIPQEVLGECWNVHFTHRSSSALEAYKLEQEMLNSLESKRTNGERVICTEGTLVPIWEALTGMPKEK